MNIALIFAGGVGSRMNSKERPKQFLEMYNKPIIIHTLEHFENHPEIDGIVVVCVDGWIDYLKNLLWKFKFCLANTWLYINHITFWNENTSYNWNIQTSYWC